jgi:predicted alpha/beta hydrolase family esterase
MKQIFVVHGGNAFEKYEEYLAYLKTKDVSLEKLFFNDWKRNLSEQVGEGFVVISPQMPNSQNARYAEWKIWFERLVPFMNDGIVFIGHSLGGIFLAKYLSENDFPKKIRATFLIAAPFNTKNEHPIADFILTSDLSKFADQGGEIFLYQSKDDFVVPYSDVVNFKKALPGSHLRTFENRGHFKQADLPELIEDIKSLI